MVDHGEAVGPGSMSIMSLKILIRCHLESIRCCARSVIGQVIKVRNEDMCGTGDSSKNCTKSKVPVCLSALLANTNDASSFLHSSSLLSPTPDRSRGDPESRFSGMSSSGPSSGFLASAFGSNTFEGELSPDDLFNIFFGGSSGFTTGPGDPFCRIMG